MSHEGQVRRVDLNFRSRYLEIETTIYKIDDGNYLIYCNKDSGNFEALQKEFNYSIKTFGTRADLVNKIPETYECVIPPILDDKISNNFEGISMTRTDILNILFGKFPNVYFYNIVDEPGKVLIHTYSFEEKIGNITKIHFLNEKDKKSILDFLSNLKLSYEFEIIEDKVEAPIPLSDFMPHNPVQYIYSNGFWKNRVPEFSERDEALWYDNIDKIFSGEFGKHNLYFYNPDEYSCYVDYSMFENIDIRNLLILFEALYVTLPYEESIHLWLKKKKISSEEFLELIKRGRIKIILTQPELRYYDSGFFKEVYKTNPNAIITRRALTALQQIDLVEISNEYIFNDIDIIRELGEFCNKLEKITKVDAKFMYDIFIWPMRARRESFQNLQYSGIMGVPAFGVNTAIEKGISSAADKDLSFEFHISAPSIHLANSLNSIYFPYQTSDGFSDYFFANIMGELLNFYKNATSDKIQSFFETRKQFDSGILPISPIDIFEVNDFVSIVELENILSKDVIFPKSKHLMEYLSSLSTEERQRKIKEYNSVIDNKTSNKIKRQGSIDLGTNFIMDASGKAMGFDFIGSTLSIGKKIKDAIPGLKKLGNKIEESFYTNIDEANIHYLSKINRVARMKR